MCLFSFQSSSPLPPSPSRSPCESVLTQCHAQVFANAAVTKCAKTLMWLGLSWATSPLQLLSTAGTTAVCLFVHVCRDAFVSVPAVCLYVLLVLKANDELCWCVHSHVHTYVQYVCVSGCLSLSLYL